MLNGVTALDRAKDPEFVVELAKAPVVVVDRAKAPVVVVELAKAPVVFGIFGKIHYLANGNKIVVVH